MKTSSPFNVQCSFGDNAVSVVGKVKKLLTPFLPQHETMCAALKLFSPGSDELAFFIEYHNRIQAVTRGMNSVVDINVTLRVLADSMSVPILNIVRELSPVMRSFVFVVPFSNNGRLDTSFIGSAQNQRAYGGRHSSRCEKTSSRDFHAFAPDTSNSLVLLPQAALRQRVRHMRSAESGFLKAESRVRGKVHPRRAIIVRAVTLRQIRSFLDRLLQKGGFPEAGSHRRIHGR